MNELLEIILEDLHFMESQGELSKQNLQMILDMIEKREYEYAQMMDARTQ